MVVFWAGGREGVMEVDADLPLMGCVLLLNLGAGVCTGVHPVIDLQAVQTHFPHSSMYVTFIKMRNLCFDE